MNKKYGYYTVFIGKKQDFVLASKVLIKNKINMFFENQKFYINFEKNDISSIKKANLEIQNPDMTSFYVNYLESDNGEILKLLKESNFDFFYIGEDGSWLSIPFVIVAHKKSLEDIKKLAKSGCFSNLKNNLWNLGV